MNADFIAGVCSLPHEIHIFVFWWHIIEHQQCWAVSECTWRSRNSLLNLVEDKHWYSTVWLSFLRWIHSCMVCCFVGISMSGDTVFTRTLLRFSIPSLKVSNQRGWSFHVPGSNNFHRNRLLHIHTPTVKICTLLNALPQFSCEYSSTYVDFPGSCGHGFHVQCRWFSLVFHWTYFRVFVLRRIMFRALFSERPSLNLTFNNLLRLVKGMFLRCHFGLVTEGTAAGLCSPVHCRARF